MDKAYWFSELSEAAQQHAYALYCEAMDDDLNRNDIVSFDEYGAYANWDGLQFDSEGNGIA